MTQKVSIDVKATLFWLLLCAGVLEAQALGLGRLQGAALIGRPLEVSVQIQTDPGEDSAALCLDVEVFHADARQDQRLVRLTLDAVPAGQIATARIVSLTPVDEPVVTVLLRAGCAQKTTRRYVLLADPPVEVLAPVVPLVAPAALVEPAAPVAAAATPTPVANGPAAGFNSQPLAPASAAAPATARVGGPNGSTATLAQSQPAAKPASAPAATKPAPAPVADMPARPAQPAGPRLTLSPAVPRADRVDKPVGVAPAAAVAPTSAAAAVAASASASAAAAAEDAAALAAQKIQALERDMKAALARSARLETSLTEMKSRLQQTESERVPMELIYGLVALVLASLLAVASLWRRLRRLQADRGEWWRHSAMAQTEPAADLERPLASILPVAAAAAPVPSQPLPEAVQPVPMPAPLPTQGPGTPSAEPAQAGAEPSLDLDNLIDFDPSQGKQPPSS
jgi:hypothetical protein